MSTDASRAYAHEDNRKETLHSTSLAGPKKISAARGSCGVCPNEAKEFSSGLDDGLPRMKLHNQ